MARPRRPPAPDAARTAALIYIRVSKYTKEDEGRKVSPQTQLELCKALPALRGLTIEDPYIDLDYTGRNTNRPRFQQMMERAQRGDVAMVACYSISRFARDVPDLYSTLRSLEDAG